MEKILSPEEIRKPRALHRLHSGATEKSWHGGQELLGGVTQREILCPGRDWTAFVVEKELQRNTNFDAFDCVTQGHWNGLETLANQKYGLKLDESKRWTALKAGTVPGRGTSVEAVSECIRTMGGVPESVCVSMTPTMTQDEFFAPIPPEVDAQENFIKDGFVFSHEWCPRSGIFTSYSDSSVLYDRLKYSPIVVCIDGDYQFDSNGYLMYGYNGKMIEYTHVVLLVGGVPDKYLIVLDSENPNGFMRVAWNYCLGYAKQIYLKKNNMFQPKIYKVTGQPALYFLNPEQNVLVPFADGVIPGGSLFKIYFGDYSNVNIETVDTLPYPVAVYSNTTI